MTKDEELVEESVPASVPAVPAGGEAAGEWIDRYQLVKQIGEGGMGTVWLAQQSEPVTRNVALKVIKLGMDTREVVRRFEAERQALAVMDHPGIAKVLDGGATKSGRPFFVMELVDGVAITEYCDETRLDLRQRLELFRSVCESIQHAHQKGIIHRDIKPSNVLVAEHDGVPHPKVIDFGIAKATGAELAQETMFTQVGQIIGTPETMAPEQAESGGADVDTRADVYSLGVLLYELLTGSKTIDVQSALEEGYHELLRTIREVDPARPSTRVSDLGHSASSIAATRRAEPATLSRHLRGDLDWIVMKALEKDRERRYETASEFALDIGRYLRNEPVLAVPPTALYRFRKLVRRRKKTVVAVSIIAILFVAGAVGTGVGFWRTLQANRALDEALGEKEQALEAEVQQRELANANAERARDAEAEARTEAERATSAEADALSEATRAAAAEADALARATELEQVSDFQYEQLRDIDPGLMGKRLRRALIDAAEPSQRDDLSAKVAAINFTNLALGALEQNIFDRTIEAIDTQFEDQPLVRARLLQSMADTLYELGLYERATGPQERALAIRRVELGPEDPSTRASIGRTGMLLQARGKLDEAEPYLREAYEYARRAEGDEHPETLIWLSGVARLAWDRGQLAEAEADQRRVVDGMRAGLGEQNSRTLKAILNLANLLNERRNFAEAETYAVAALDGFRNLYGDDHASTLHAVSTMGGLLFGQGRLEEAEPYMREALAGRRRALGDEHPSTLLSINNLATLLKNLGRMTEAEPLMRESLEGQRRVLGDEHSDTLILMRNFGGLLEYQGKLAEAESTYRTALQISRRKLGDDHPNTLNLVGSLGLLLERLDLPEEAELYLREAIDRRRRSLGDGHRDTLVAIYNLGVILRNRGRVLAAEPLLREALEGKRRLQGREHSDTQEAVKSLRTLYVLLVEAARKEQREILLGEALAKHGALELHYGSPVDAELLLAEALDLAYRTLPETDLRLAQVLGDLGAAIHAQGRFADAEPLVRESAELALALPTDRSESTDPADELVQRAIDFYNAWHAIEPEAGHDAKAQAFHARRQRE